MHGSHGGGPRVVALMNQKGGVGKTTTTVNLAAGLAELGRRTLLIDLDPQAHATLHLGVDPGEVEASVYDLLVEPEENIDLDATVREVRPGLDLIPSETDLAAAETELASLEHRQRRLARALAPIADRYEFILLDCPPSLGLLTINGLALASEVLIPMQAQFLALQGVGKLLETIAALSKQVNPDLRVAGIILCMFDAQTTLAQEVVGDLNSFFDSQRNTPVPWRDAVLFDPPVRRNIKLAECPSFGQTIFEYAPWAPGAADYRKLAETLANRSANAPVSTETHAAPEPPPANEAADREANEPAKGEPEAPATAPVESHPAEPSDDRPEPPEVRVMDVSQAAARAEDDSAGPR
ncbi:MAG: AAA family ATPase [Phycisphaerales bacterium JB037]